MPPIHSPVFHCHLKLLRHYSGPLIHPQGVSASWHYVVEACTWNYKQYGIRPKHLDNGRHGGSHAPIEHLVGLLEQQQEGATSNNTSLIPHVSCSHPPGATAAFVAIKLRN